MVLVNHRQSFDDYCSYNFCSGKHQHIEQKTKSVQNPNGYLLLALANSVKTGFFKKTQKFIINRRQILCAITVQRTIKTLPDSSKRGH